MDRNTKQIAKNRIRILFGQASENWRTNPILSRHYVETARKVAMTSRIHLPTKYRRQICKKCSSLLVAGANSRVRIKHRREPHLVITCLHCGSTTRILLQRRKERLEQNNNSNETSR